MAKQKRSRILNLLIKLYSSPFNFRLALGASGGMFELCPYTGLAIPLETPEKIQDFIITATSDGIEILALTQNESNSKFLKVFDYPSELNTSNWKHRHSLY